MIQQPKQSHHNGSALITALFIMTLVAIAATAMSTRLQFDIFGTQQTINRDRLYLASEAVTYWAISRLSNESVPTKSQGHGKLLHFPTALQHIYPGAVIHGELYDMQAFFNVNNLQDKKYYPVFFKLLNQTFPLLNGPQCKDVLDSIAYWINPYQPGRGQDEYLNFYQKQNPPYLPGFQAMTSISELRLVYGVNKDTYQKLLPVVAALPEVTPININTASSAILRSLGNGLSQTEVDELLQARGEDGISDLKDVFELLQKLNIPNDQITIKSTYFLSVATVSLNTLHLTAHTLIKRSIQANNSISVSVVNQTLNTL